MNPTRRDTALTLAHDICAHEVAKIDPCDVLGRAAFRDRIATTFTKWQPELVRSYAASISGRRYPKMVHVYRSIADTWLARAVGEALLREGAVV